MEYLELWASDQFPIRICFAMERDDPKRNRFFFDKRYLNKNGIEELIKESWGTKEFDQSNTMELIGRCRKKIMKWKRYSRLKDDLEKEVAKVYPSYNRMKKLKLDLAEALKEEETYWRQRCREEWLRSGYKKFPQLCERYKTAEPHSHAAR